MNRLLLLVTLFLTAGITLCYGQTDLTLGRATSFSVLAKTKITAKGPVVDGTEINGNVGISPGSTIEGEEFIKILGRTERNTDLAAEAMGHALAAYQTLWQLEATQSLGPKVGSEGVGATLKRGVYRSTGNVEVAGNLVLDGEGDVNSVFVFLIEGDFKAKSGKIQITDMGASAKNIYWVVKGEVNIDANNAFLGNIIAEKDITFGNGASLGGRAISLGGSVNFDFNKTALPVLVSADLNVTKEAEQTDLSIGKRVVYTITATNQGPGIARNVVVKERIPTGLRFIGVREVSRGAYNRATNEWVLGDMANGEKQTIRLEFEVTGTGNIRNEVIIIGDDPDPNPDDDKDDEVIILPDLGVTKELVNAQSKYYVGDAVQYRIVVTNYAAAEEKNVKVGEKLPAGLEYLSHEASIGTYDPVTGIFNIPVLTASTPAVLTINARLVKSGTVRNVVSIISKDPKPNNPTDPTDPDDDYEDSDPDNDDDDVVIPEVECRPNAEVAIEAAQTTVCAGAESLTFKATSAVIGGKYKWVLPLGWSFAEGTDQTASEVKVNVGPDLAGGSKKVKVTVTDQCGKEASAEIAIAVTGAPAVPAIKEGVTSVCFNSDGITLEAAAVVEGLQYEWSVDANLEIVGASNGTSVVVRPKEQSLAGGKVTLKVTNACGFSSTSFRVLTVTPAPAAPVSITGKAAVCAGEQVTYTAASVAGASSYTWTLPVGWAFADPNADNTTKEVKVIAGTSNGKITVAARVDACNISSATAELAVTVTNMPEAPEGITGNVSACIGEAFTYAVTNPVDGVEYVWTLPQGWSIEGSRTGSSIRVKVGSNAVAGQITAAVKNSCFTGPVASLAVKPNAKPAMPGPITPPTIEVCATSTGNVYRIAAVPGADSYKWTLPAGWAFAEGTPTDGTQITVVAGTAGGTIRVKASNECGDSEERTLNITVATIPAAPVAITGNGDLCSGVIETYSVTAPVNGVTYNWSVPATGGWEIVEGNGTARVRVKIGTTAGSIEVAAANACGASSSKASLAIRVTNKPEAPTIAADKTASCIGEKLTFRVEQPIAGLTYTWAVPATWTASATTGTSIEVTVGTGSGDIKVYATNQCGDGAVASLAVAPTLAPATPGAINSNMNVCINSTGNVFSIAAVTGADSYEWEVPAGWVIEGAANGTSISATATETGGIVRVRAINGCGMSEWSVLNIAITMPPAPVARITDNSSVCDGLVFTADPVAGATSYTWTVTEGFTIESGQGTTTIKVKANNPNAKGEVSVVALNGSCEGSASFSIPVDASVADGQLELPKAFSPNGDGKNDTWMISNLLKFSDNEVVIFNRWGSEVYKQRSYKNDWAAKGLEQGTYFYKVRVKLCDGVYKEFTGYVAIFR